MTDDLKLTQEELEEISSGNMEGWNAVPGTKEPSSSRWVNFVTEIHETDGRFYAVTYAENAGDGESASEYPSKIVEVFPETVTVIRYAEAKP